MNSNLSFDFFVNKESRTISVKREFKAELSHVWDACTKSEILDKWWAPRPWKAGTKMMDSERADTGSMPWLVRKVRSIGPGLITGILYSSESSQALMPR